jgi:hypothetical protein
MRTLKSEFWVKAYLKRLSLEGISGYVVHHGDDDAGDLLIKVSTFDGAAQLFQREHDLETRQRVWNCTFFGSEEDTDALVKKKLGFDPDLWVLEVEEMQGRHFLDSTV